MTETKTKRGRPPKSSTTKKKTEENQIKTDNQDEIIKQLMNQIEEQNKKMAEMQSQINNQPQTTIIQQNSGLSGKKVKVVNLMHNPLNISTEPNGMGRVFTFREYGDTRLIKYDDLADIVAAYPNTMEGGLAYICDKDVVESLGLAEEYEKLFDKSTMDKIIKLREESDLELFLGMNKNLQESAAIKIAERINTNERVDYNYINTIKEKTGIDIEEIAKNLKDLQRKPDDEE